MFDTGGFLSWAIGSFFIGFWQAELRPGVRRRCASKRMELANSMLVFMISMPGFTRINPDNLLPERGRLARMSRLFASSSLVFHSRSAVLTLSRHSRSATALSAGQAELRLADWQSAGCPPTDRRSAGRRLVCSRAPILYPQSSPICGSGCGWMGNCSGGNPMMSSTLAMMASRSSSVSGRR